MIKKLVSEKSSPIHLYLNPLVPVWAVTIIFAHVAFLTVIPHCSELVSDAFAASLKDGRLIEQECAVSRFCESLSMFFFAPFSYLAIPFQFTHYQECAHKDFHGGENLQNPSVLIQLLEPFLIYYFTIFFVQPKKSLTLRIFRNLIRAVISGLTMLFIFAATGENATCYHLSCVLKYDPEECFLVLYMVLPSLMAALWCLLRYKTKIRFASLLFYRSVASALSIPMLTIFVVWALSYFQFYLLTPDRPPLMLNWQLPFILVSNLFLCFTSVLHLYHLPIYLGATYHIFPFALVLCLYLHSETGIKKFFR